MTVNVNPAFFPVIVEKEDKYLRSQSEERSPLMQGPSLLAPTCFEASLRTNRPDSLESHGRFHRDTKYCYKFSGTDSFPISGRGDRMVSGDADRRVMSAPFGRECSLTFFTTVNPDLDAVEGRS